MIRHRRTGMYSFFWELSSSNYLLSVMRGRYVLLRNIRYTKQKELRCGELK